LVGGTVTSNGNSLAGSFLQLNMNRSNRAKTTLKDPIFFGLIILCLNELLVNLNFLIRLKTSVLILSIS
jgi:hypothetical protein